jgi:SAM-dependent methyltransferase
MAAATPGIDAVPASFRDPDGFVVIRDGRVLRCVSSGAREGVAAFLASPLARTWMESGSLVRTWDLENSPGWLEHQPVAFPSFPYEWPAEMLYHAAALILTMARQALDAGFRMKDATPYNVLYEGPRPVFIDVLSFEPGAPLDPLWRPFAQFVQTFIYPLLAWRHFELRPDEVLLANRDGWEPRRMLAMLPWWRRLVPPFLGAVTIPELLSRGRQARSPGAYGERQARDAGEARFLARRVLRRAEKLLASCTVPIRRNASLRYAIDGHTYSDAGWAAKESFVRGALAAIKPQRVLDIGANTGHYARIAASAGASVVAIDSDPAACGLMWRKAQASGLSVLPLVINIARPTAACGWANGEHASFLDRARGRFDCVMLLAVIHHLIATERIPLASIVSLVAGLTTGAAIVEFVDPADSQFRILARGREALHTGLTRQSFEAALSESFEIVEAHGVQPTRRLYRLVKRSQPS